MEARGATHDWAGRFREHGPMVQLMTPRLSHLLCSRIRMLWRMPKRLGQRSPGKTRRGVPVKGSVHAGLALGVRALCTALGPRCGGSSTRLIADIRGSVPCCNDEGPSGPWGRWRPSMCGECLGAPHARSRRHPRAHSGLKRRGRHREPAPFLGLRSGHRALRPCGQTDLSTPYCATRPGRP
jgi:hypothetical protein